VGVVIVGALTFFGLRFVVPPDTVQEMRASVGLEQGQPERHIVPEGFQGWASVRYGVADAVPLVTENGVRIHRYPDSGALVTSSPDNPGIKTKGYFFAGPAGQTPVPRYGDGRRVRGAHDLTVGNGENDENGAVERSSWFFVGTHEEYGRARAALLHPGIPDLPVLPDPAEQEAP